MKKKIMAVLLTGMMLLAGCAGKVTVGEYKGLVLTSVSQATVDAEIQEMLDYYATVETVERAAEDGDTVNIDYVGTLDGVAFDGGTDEGYDLVLGSDSFIDGFEDGLVGAIAGETRELTLVFPEEYKNNPDLAGQTVVFTVTVNEVKTTVTPELTDEFLAEKYPEYPSVAKYTEALRDAMNYETYYEQVTEQIMASSEVTRYNESEVTLEKEELIAQYTSYAEYYGAYYGLDTESAIIYFLGFESVDAFKEEMGEYAREVVKNAMIIKEIAKTEGLEPTDEVYEEKIAEYAESYGYDDTESFLEAYGEDTVKDAILAEVVMDFIIDNATIVEAD